MARNSGLASLFDLSYGTGDPTLDALFALPKQEEPEYPEEAVQEGRTPVSKGQRKATKGGSGEENLRRVYDILVNEKGLAPHHAAGIVGNFAQESGGNPAIVGGNVLPNDPRSVGFGQWNRERLYGGKGYVGLIPFAEQQGASPNDLHTQVDYMMQELSGPERAAFERLLKTTTVEDAARAFGEGYERPRKQYANYENRIAQAKKYFGAEPASYESQQEPSQLASTEEPPYDQVYLTDGQVFNVEKGMGLDEVEGILKQNGIEARPVRPFVAPDGKQFNVEYDMTDDEVMNILNKPAPGESNYLGAMQHGMQSAVSGMAMGAGTELGALGEAAGGAGFLGDYAQPVSEFLKEKGAQAHTYGEELGKEIEGKYTRPENLNLLEEYVTYPAAETFGQMLPYVAAAPLAAIPGVGPAAATAATLGAVHAGTMGGGEQEALAAGKEWNPDEYRPYAGAIDVANMVGLGAFNKALKVFGKEAILGSREAIQAAVEKGGIEEAKKLVGSRLGNIAKETGMGELALVGGEVVEDAINREYLGKPLLDEEALQQYGETAKQVGPLGLFTGPMAGLGAHYNKATEVARLEEQADVEQKLQAQELERAKAEQLATVGVTPEQLQKFGVKKELEGLSDEELLDAFRADLAEKEAAKAAKLEELPEELRNVPYKEARAYQQMMQEKEAGEVPSEEVTPPVSEPTPPVSEATAPVTEPTAPVEPVSGVTPPTAEVGAEEIPEPFVRGRAQEVPTQETANPADILGLKSNSGLRKKLQGLDVNNVADHPKIDAILQKTSATFSAENLATLETKMKEIQNASQVEVPKPSDAGRRQQPQGSEEVGYTPVSGEGVRISDQEGKRIAGEGEIKAPEVKEPKYSLGERPEEAATPESVSAAIRSVTGDKDTAWNVRVHNTIEEAQKMLNAEAYNKVNPDYSTVQKAIDHFENTGELDDNDPYLPRFVLSPKKHIEFLRSLSRDIEKIAKDRGIAAPILEKDAQGFVIGDKAHLISRNIPKGREMGVLLHEVGTHLGMEKMLKADQHARLSQRVHTWAKDSTNIEGEIARAAKERAAESDSELIAYFVEEAVNRGVDPTALKPNSALGAWFRELLAAFKNTLRKLGLTNIDKLSAQDVVDLAYGAAHLEMKGKWHGSPHEFSKFQLKYRGTGEGGLDATSAEKESFQDMIGWGHYMSGRRDIAEEYRDRLSKDRAKAEGRLDVKGYAPKYDAFKDEDRIQSDAYEQAVDALQFKKGNFAAAKKYLERDVEQLIEALRSRRIGDETLEKYITTMVQPAHAAALKHIDALEKVGAEYILPKEAAPTLYSLGVNAFDDELIDWTAKIEEQSPKVQKVFNDIKDKMEKADTLNEFMEKTNPLEDFLNFVDRDWEDLTGENLYRGLLRWAHNTNAIPELSALSKNTDKAASEYLDNLGIKGIRYPVMGGAKRGENFVIFNDKNVHIVQKNAPSASSGEVRYSKQTPKPSKEEVRQAEERIKASGMVGAMKDKTAGEKFRQFMDDIFTDGRNTSFVSEMIDIREPIAKAVQNLPDNVGKKLRSDYLYSAYEQRGNVIQDSYHKGFVAMGRDGTIETVKDNQLALAEIYKRVGEKKVELFNNVLVASRVRSIRAADAKTHAQANQMLNMADEMEEYAGRAKDTAKRKKFNAAARNLRNMAEKKLESINWDKGRTDFTEQEVQDADTLLAAYPELAREAENVYALLRKSVDMWENEGMVDKETAKEWREYPNYIPLYKKQDFEKAVTDPSQYVDEMAKQMGKGPKSIAKVHRQKWHEHAVFVEENLIRHIAFFASAAAEHSARKNTAYNLELVGKAERIKPGTGGKKDLITRFKENGKIVEYRVDDPAAYYAMQSAMPLVSPMLKRLRDMTGFARGVMIMNPLFWFRQAFREPVQASLVGRAGVVTPLDTLAAAAKIAAGSSKGYERLRTKGTIGPVDVIADPAEFIKISHGKKGFISKGITGIKHVHELMDAATRTVVYEKAKADALSKGFDEDTADAIGVMKAREIINFAKQGRSKFIRGVRATTPFFGAQLNSLDVMARAMAPRKAGHLSKAEAMEARRNFYSNALMLATFSTAYAAVMSEDEDYLKEPDRVGNWLVPLGDHKFLKIPIPFEAGWFTKELPELMVLFNSGALNKKEALKEGGKGLITNVVPPMPTIWFMQPFLEVAADHDFFTGSSLEGRDSEVALRDRNSKASDLSKEIVNKMEDLGINLFGVSANQLEHINKKLLGQLWAITRVASDAYINRGKVTPRKELEEYPLISGAVTSGAKDRAVNQFYEVAKEATEIQKSFERAKSTADIERFQEILNDPDNVKYLKASKRLRELKANIGETRQGIEKIMENPGNRLDQEEMTRRIKVLKERQVLIAKEGVKEARKLGLEI